MPIARSGRIWRPVFAVLLIAVVGVYVWKSRQGFAHGGSPIGLTYGIAGYGLILLLAFYGVRKRMYRSTFGTLEQWLQSHIYLGILTLVILALHSGGRFHDLIAVATLVLAAIVVFSGILGSILYITVPRMLTEFEGNLTPETISEQLNQLARSMARTASDKSVAFQRVYNDLVGESRPGWLGGWRLIFSSTRRTKSAAPAEWARLIGLVPRSEQDELRQMLVTSRQRKELLIRLLYQQRYKNILEAWLYVHVPFTVALILFGLVHVAAVFYYGRLR